MSLIEKLLQALNIGGSTDSETYTVALVIISIAAILFLGFLATRITKLIKLPNVTAYILVGILIGPSVINLIPNSFIEKSEFLSDIALAFISFSVGEFFKLESLKKAGLKVVIITLFESLLTFFLVFFVMFVLCRVEVTFSIVLGALSSATAPASTLMTIRQTNAKGEYVDTLLEVIALDNILTLLLYSISISLCLVVKNGGTSVSFETIGWPIIRTFLCIAIGLVFGVLLKLLLPKRRTTDNRLIIVISVLLAFCGICSLLNESPLLGCMMIGTVYTNMMDDDDKLFSQVNYFAPPIMLLFFVRSGAKLNFSYFTSDFNVGTVPMIAITIIYLVSRMIGKYSGSYLGSFITKKSKNVRNYLGLGLMPQASVVIGLVSIGSRIFIDNGQEELGNALFSIIIASSVLYEIVGPACAKLGLYLSKSFSNNIDEVAPTSKKFENEVEKLISQILEIQKDIKININPNEDAFTDAALEFENDIGLRNQKFINRRK